MAKRRVGIKPIVAIVIMALVAAIGCGLSYLKIEHLKSEIADAEAEMPESAISAYLTKIKNRNFDSIYEDSMIVEPHLNGKEEYIATLEEIYAGVNVSDIQFVPSENSSDNNLVYTLVANRHVLADVHLMKSDEGAWLASTIFRGDHSLKMEVPAGKVPTINGNPLDSSYCIAREVVSESFDGMHQTGNAPRVDIYEVQNLLTGPEIGIEGESDYATLKDVVSGTIYVGKRVDDASIANAFINDIVTAAKYPAQETSLGSVASVSVTDSDWYDRIRTLQNNWFTSHSASAFSNERAFNMIHLSDQAVVGYVTFDYYAANSEVNRTWHSGFQLSLINEGGSWKIADMGTDSSLNEANQ